MHTPHTPHIHSPHTILMPHTFNFTHITHICHTPQYTPYTHHTPPHTYLNTHIPTNIPHFTHTHTYIHRFYTPAPRSKMLPTRPHLWIQWEEVFLEEDSEKDCERLGRGVFDGWAVWRQLPLWAAQSWGGAWQLARSRLLHATSAGNCYQLGNSPFGLLLFL